jgi:hypothetical protein
MTFPSQPFRLTLLSIGCLGLLYLLMMLFQSRDRALIDAAKMWVPFLAVTVPPYLIVLWRLSVDRNDFFGLGFAIACAAISVVLLVAFVWAMASVKEMAPLNLIVGLMYWNVTLLTAAFVFVPLQIKLASSAFAALAAAGGGRTAGSIVLGAVLAIAYTSVTASVLRPLGEGTAASARRTEYAQTTATQHLFTLYKCLWRHAGPGAVNGFPASEEALRALGDDCWDPANAPGGTAYGTHYAFRYMPGAPDANGKIRSFGMATKKYNRRGTWTDSYFIDHLGLFRQSSTEWATARTDRIESFQRSLVPDMAGLLDGFRNVRGVYPARILHHTQKDSAGPYDMVLSEGMLLARTAVPGPDNTSLVDCHRARIVYAPVLSADGKGASAYTFTLRGAYDSVRDFRSYFMNTDGRIHATGEERDATAADPVAPDNEWALGSRENMRRRMVATLAQAQASAR